MSEWIKPTVRLPVDPNESVWCWGTYEGQYAPCGFEGIYRHGRWVCLNIDGDDYEAVVSDWQPFPEPPEDCLNSQLDA